MPDYLPIADTEIDPDSPITTSLMTRLRDNPLALVAALAVIKTDSQVNGSYTIPSVPSTVTAWQVMIDAAGGGGGGSQGATNGGGGGGSAAQLHNYTVELLPGDVITWTIGAGGAVNGNGGNTTITITRSGVTLVSFTLGGGAGSPNNQTGGAGGSITTTVQGGIGTDGASTTYNRTLTGGPFVPGVQGANAAFNGTGGDGGPTIWNRGGTRGIETGAAPTAGSRGSGGGGAADGSTNAQAGGTGFITIRLRAHTFSI